MKDSEISWTHHTFNPWWGCVKVSPGCEACYAETLSKRWGHKIWGPAKTTQRRLMSDDYWKQPLKWNAAAEKAGTRARVFCASMADVFEDHPGVTSSRIRLWDLIRETPMLDWLLLTKRPENILQMIPDRWRSHPRHNVWYGTSVENQEYADRRIPELLKVPAVVRFLSCEPLLGPVDIFDYLWESAGPEWAGYNLAEPGIHWVIAGGESGPGARPMHPDWARSLRDQCSYGSEHVAFHFKQWGEYLPLNDRPAIEVHGKVIHDDARFTWVRVGKKAAGRLLDGRTWDDFPTPKVPA
jgi:protein gp37